MRALLALLLVAVAAGCLGPSNLEDASFPCRGANDCVEGWVCEPVRFVCVPEGAPATDAGVSDSAGASD